MDFAIRRLYPGDDRSITKLHRLHEQCFPNNGAPKIKKQEIKDGWWWLAENDSGRVVGFAGMMPAASNKGFCYLSRVGVHPKFRGHGLQKKLIRVRERTAKRDGYRGCVTDAVTYNSPSANSLIAEGYKVFNPKTKWGLSQSIYFRKVFE